eukprot:gnl/TRDRNA2_/TRDRNA2_138181_c0_seq1.p1 gnl/TRDRNA2_/TRDRNA2_138181_c0~~gnl/TRDRNA2_/TRDRNA2_138181_c0_seq1.p1  ORF type:complete len:558 (-),score=78.55 gnl/TRDRNA2_/TRDRNA2_138181_c0_seq1:139-1629(-)
MVKSEPKDDDDTGSGHDDVGSEHVPLPRRQGSQIKGQGPARRGSSHLSKTTSDEEEVMLRKPSSFRLAVLRVVSSSPFEIFIVVIILANAFTDGVQIDWMATHPGDSVPFSLWLLGYCYSIIFSLELMLKLFAYGKKFFSSERNFMWNYLDLLIVLAFLFEVLVDVINAQSEDKVDGSNGMRSLRIVRMVRITRLLRVFRVLRIVRFIRALRTLVYSITCTMKSVIWSFMLILMIIYVFALLFTQSVADYLATEVQEDLLGATVSSAGALDLQFEEGNLRYQVWALQRWWGTLPRSMFTLFKSISGGVDWESAVQPLSQIGWGRVLVAIFAGYIAFLMFAVLNVVTGVFCQSAMESAQHDADMAVQNFLENKRHYVEHLGTLFKNIDDDNSGTISLKEFEEHLEDAEVQACFATLELETADALQLFRLLDEEGTGKVNFEEFVEGCFRLKGNAKSIDLGKVMRAVQHLETKVSRLVYEVQAQKRIMAQSYISVTQP